MENRYYIVSSPDGRAIGRMTIIDQLGWVEQPFASVYRLDDAERVAGMFESATVTPMPEQAPPRRGERL